MKRLFDLSAACIGLVFLWPLLLFLSLLIRLETPGPGIFVQDRVGRHGNVFRCYKLRSMRHDAPNTPTHLAKASEVTRLGAFLRTTKLDELPQLLNIVRGEMSLVGPRPCLPQQAELIQERRQRGVLEILPGVTGLAQVKGIDMSDPVRLAEIDAEYVKMSGFGLDLKLLYRTIFRSEGKGDRIRSHPD